jgi:hypothetical protein
MNPTADAAEDDDAGNKSTASSSPDMDGNMDGSDGGGGETATGAARLSDGMSMPPLCQPLLKGGNSGGMTAIQEDGGPT